MQIVRDSMHEISNPILLENKKLFQIVIGWKFYPACQVLKPLQV